MKNMNFFDLFSELTKLPYNELSREIVSHALSVAKFYEPDNYSIYLGQCNAWKLFNS